MENFTALFGGAEPPPAAAAALGFGPAKAPGAGAAPPPAAAAPPPGEDAARKAAAGPFYLLRELPGTTELTGSTNLITHYNLEHAYNKFCGKKVKEKLSNFLPDLPGMIDLPGSHDNSSLRSLIEKPPICGSSFTPLTSTMLTGFRLHAGPLPEQCRLMHIQPPKKKNKHKHKQSRTQDPVPPETPSDSDHKKKKKKKEEDPERKRKKKEKKKKKVGGNSSSCRVMPRTSCPRRPVQDPELHLCSWHLPQSCAPRAGNVFSRVLPTNSPRRSRAQLHTGPAQGGGGC
uniref:Mediator of RNA polymerase II transcription subunit 19 n=1 Tax=Melopsittacus undulatus TaxID=13146 RepID=A0A8V5FZI9_MELUD